MGSGEGVTPPQLGGVWEGAVPLPEFFFNFSYGNSVFWCNCTHCLYLNSKLVSRSQLRRPRHEEQHQSNVRSSTEAITGEAMSIQHLKSMSFAVSAINSAYVL